MEFVTYEQDGFVGVVTINRPKALNALNSEVLKEIEATFDAIDLDATRAVVLTGAGDKSFVAYFKDIEAEHLEPASLLK